MKLKGQSSRVHDLHLWWASAPAEARGYLRDCVCSLAAPTPSRDCAHRDECSGGAVEQPPPILEIGCTAVRARARVSERKAVDKPKREGAAGGEKNFDRFEI